VDEGLNNAEVEDLYRRYGFFLRRRCLLLLRSAALADDALQETFLKLIRNGGGVRSADHPLRWLYRVAERTCFDHLRNGKKLRNVETLDDVANELPCCPGTTPELRRMAIDILEVLNEEHQRIAAMAFVDGMTHQEIADELGYSRMTIIKRVAHIREQAERTTRERPPQRVLSPRRPS
jgi:RNA polymerase sigma-70 factor (ECF subfamily)